MTLLISFVLLAGVVLRLWQERKAGNVLSALSAPLSCSVTVRRSGALCSIESGQLCVGDVVVLCAGERVPADLRLIITHDLFLSQSQLTGESRVLEKNADMLPDAHGALSDYPNLALMGTSVVSGTAEGVVLAVGRQTVYGSQLSALGHNKRTFDGGASFHDSCRGTTWQYTSPFSSTIACAVAQLESDTRHVTLKCWSTSYLLLPLPALPLLVLPPSAPLLLPALALVVNVSPSLVVRRRWMRFVLGAAGST